MPLLGAIFLLALAPRQGASLAANLRGQRGVLGRERHADEPAAAARPTSGSVQMYRGGLVPKLSDSPQDERCMQALPFHGTMKGPNKWQWMLNLASRLKGVPGDVVEAGVAEGGAVLALLFYLGCTNDLEGREVHLFDTWEGLPPPTKQQDAGFATGQFFVGMEGLQKSVAAFNESYEALFEPENQVNGTQPMSFNDAWSHVRIHKGLFNTTMPKALVTRQIAFLMCDGDMYGSTMDCMEAAEPRLVKGGWHYNDDYYSFLGSYRAVKDYRQKVNITSDKEESQIFNVPNVDADLTVIPDDPTRCTPPIDNGGYGGTCDSKHTEAAFWQKLE